MPFRWLTMSRVSVTVEKWMTGWSRFPDREKVSDWRTTKILFVLLPDGLREVDSPWTGAVSPEVYGKKRLFLDNTVAPQIIGTRRGCPFLLFGSGSAWHCISSGWQHSDNTGQTLGECCGMAHCEEGRTAVAAERRAATADCLCIYWYCTVKKTYTQISWLRSRNTLAVEILLHCHREQLHIFSWHTANENKLIQGMLRVPNERKRERNWMVVAA